MNIKIGDLLFEENNSNEIHEVFESNLLKEEDVNLNKRGLEIVAKKVCQLMSSAFPDSEDVLSGEVSQQQIVSGLKKLEKRKISGGFEVNFFNIKGVKGDPENTPPISQADLEIYKDIGFVIFEIVAVGAIAITFEFLIPSAITFFLKLSQSRVSDLSTFKYSLPLFSASISIESFGSTPLLHKEPSYV